MAVLFPPEGFNQVRAMAGVGQQYALTDATRDGSIAPEAAIHASFRAPAAFIDIEADLRVALALRKTRKTGRRLSGSPATRHQGAAAVEPSVVDTNVSSMPSTRTLHSTPPRALCLNRRRMRLERCL